MKAGPLLAAGAIESPPLRPPRVTPVRRYAPSCDGARRYPPPGAPDKQCPVWGAGPHPRDPTGRKTNTAPWGPHDVAHLLCSSHSYGFGAFGTPHSSVSADDSGCHRKASSKRPVRCCTRIQSQRKRSTSACSPHRASTSSELATAPGADLRTLASRIDALHRAPVCAVNRVDGRRPPRRRRARAGRLGRRGRRRAET
jgi:hypothetical protein